MLNLKEALSLNGSDDLRFWFLRLFTDESRSLEEREAALLNIVFIFWKEDCNGQRTEYCPLFEEYVSHWLKANGEVVPDRILKGLSDRYDLPEVSRISSGTCAFIRS